MTVIQVYWGSDFTSAQEWFTVIDRIFHKPQAGDPPHPDVVSISWTLIGGDDFITAPGAQIQVYWGSDFTSAQDWFTVIDRIFHKPQAGDPPHPDVVSISWTLIDRKSTRLNS